MNVILAQPRGFCAGVVRAIDTVEQALAQFGAPVYVRHEIVHNRHVVQSLRDQGAVFVEELEQVPSGAYPARWNTRRRNVNSTCLMPPARW